jgi:hypothetical protein
MIIYRQGQRKVYCYRIDMDATYRLDNILLVDDAYTVTRSHKKPRIEPDKEKTLKPKLHA